MVTDITDTLFLIHMKMNQNFFGYKEESDIRNKIVCYLIVSYMNLLYRMKKVQQRLYSYPLLYYNIRFGWARASLPLVVLITRLVSLFAVVRCTDLRAPVAARSTPGTPFTQTTV